MLAATSYIRKMATTHTTWRPSGPAAAGLGIDPGLQFCAVTPTDRDLRRPTLSTHLSAVVVRFRARRLAVIMVHNGSFWALRRTNNYKKGRNPYSALCSLF
jgi:hypothetical protein